MIKIALFTTTRAEFGILSPLIRQMTGDKDIEPLLFIGGTHFSEVYGNTINEIKDYGYEITDTFDFLLKSSDSYSLVKGLSVETKKVASIFKRYDFDFVCIVGDRYELLPIVSSAILFKKPIIHIHGGEKSEGAFDEQIRHMITKAAHLHFVVCDEYAENIRMMGESDWRVCNTGALGIDSIVKSERLSKELLFAELGLVKNKPMVIMTYHPVTLEFVISPQEQIQNIFYALKDFEVQLIITSPNNEVDRDVIVNIIKREVCENASYNYIESLGIKKYYSLIPHSEFVIGNSSSGIIEVPYFKIPTVNIGNRQDGRIRHESVIDTDYSIESVKSGIKKALSKDYRNSLREMQFRFGDGHAAEKMVEIIKSIKVDQRFLRKRLEFVGR